MDMGRKRIIRISVCGIICVGIMGIIIFFTYGGGTKPFKQDVKEFIVDMIAKDSPEIRKASDELEYLHIIREWVFSKTMWAGTKDFYVDVTSIDRGDPGMIEYYNNIITAWEKEGTYCGGMAWYLAEFYIALGYPSMTLDLAVLDEEGNVLASHVVTLVLFQGKWIVEDATFNCFYEDEAGNILDVREIRARIKEGLPVEKIQGAAENKLCISSLPFDGDIFECLDSYEENGVYFNTIKMDFDRFLMTRPDGLKPIFDKANLALTAENMFAYCYDIYQPLAQYKYILWQDIKNEILP